MKITAALVLLLSCLASGCTALTTGDRDLSLLHDRRTNEAIRTDERIETNTNIELNALNKTRDKTHVNVNAYNGKVLITGEASNRRLRDKIVAVVRTIPGVKLVHNEIIITEPSTLANHSTDAMITTRVKSSLSKVRNLPGFDATRVKVVTENAVVFLMGLLHRNEAHVATEIARREDGVKKVVKVFEYIE